MKTASTTALASTAEGEAIVLSGTKLQRFFSAVYELNASLTSLNTTPQHFPVHCGACPGDIDPQVAVESFVLYASKRVEKMLSILEDEEVIGVNSGDTPGLVGRQS